MHASPEYEIETLLDEDSNITLYRARARDGRRVLVKALKSAHRSPSAVHSLQRELQSSRLLGRDVAVEAEQISTMHGGPILVLRDDGGTPLSCRTGEAMDLEAFLPLSIHLADVLMAVHEKRMAHLRLNPHHVIVMPHDGVRLTAFGHAEITPVELKAQPDRLSSSMWPYLSPEQTGRLGLPLDHRSDLYALGVIYFELLTGRLPFSASDLLGWVHCHCAVAPPSPARYIPTLPAPVAGIVLRLLAKLPDDRYQSANGARHDLVRCQQEWIETGQVEPFALGQADVLPPLRLATKIYGREDEIERLKTILAQTGDDGRARVVLVSGPSGTGKTELVRYLPQVVTERSALFASGKCDAAGQDVPYCALLQALEAILVAALEENRESIEELRHRMINALRVNASLIAEVLPALTQIVGDGSPPDVALEDLESRFFAALSQFIGAFAQPQRPLVIFLDDLQWADSGTLKVIEYWATDPTVHHTLLIGAFRSAGVSGPHPLCRMIARMVEKDADVTEMPLAPLSVQTVTRWVADSLRSPPEDASPLGDLIHGKTGGNPFFVAQFVGTLVREGLVYFSTDARAWRWDLPTIQAQRYSDDVADLIAASIRTISPTAQETLRLFACHGSSVDLPTLAILVDGPEHVVIERLQSAFAAGLIARVGDEIRFLHDRILQVAYELTPAEERAETHLRIGHALLLHLAPERLSDRIFEIVHHINAGASKIVSPDERVRAAELNLMAARKAKAAAHYGCAIGFSTTGIALLGDSGWENQHERAFALELTLAQCHFATGELAKAQELCRGLLARARSKTDAAAAGCLLASVQARTGDMETAIEIGLNGLHLFGVDLPRQPTDAEVDAAYDAIFAQLVDRPIATLLDLPPMTDADTRAMCDLIEALYLPTAFTNQSLFSLATCMAVGLSLAHGNASSSAYAYAAFGMGLASRYRRYREAFAFGEMAYQLAQRQEQLGHRVGARFVFPALLSVLRLPIRQAIELLRRECRLGVTGADTLLSCYFDDQTIQFRLFAGDPLDEIHEDALHYFTGAVRSADKPMQAAIRIQQKMIARLRGSAEADEIADTAIECYIERTAPDLMRFRYYAHKLQARFMFGELREALEAAERARPFQGAPPSRLAVGGYQFFAALALAASHTPTSVTSAELETLAAHREFLEGLVESCPENFAHLASLVAAELARLSGDELGAERAYEEAIRTARAGGFVHIEGLGSELVARFQRQRGFETAADAYLAQARDCYEAWGARGKVEALTRQYPQLSRRQGAGAGGNEQLDVLGMWKASQAISSALLMPDLHDRLLSVALEQAGAERGCLLLVSSRDLVLSAGMGADAGAFGRTDQVAEPKRIPLSVCNAAMRTGRPVILADAAVPHRYTTDPYFASAPRRSVLCLPIIRQEEVTGLLYLENNLIPGAFSGARLSVLDILASQAAISLENARLYTKLRHENAKRKRAEASLRKSKALLQAIIDNTPAVIFVKDPEGRYLLVNRRFEELFHVSCEEIRGKTDQDIFAQKYADVFRVNDLAVLRDNRVIETDESVSHDDGVHEYLSVKFPLRDSAGSPYAVCGVATDVTSIKRTTEELRQSLSLLKATLDSTADGILVVDRAGRIVQFNRRYAELWRIPEAILIARDDGRAIEFVLDQLENPEEFLDKVRSLYDEPEQSSVDVLRFKDGRVFERYSQPQYFGGLVIGRVWSFRDVTQRVEAEQERDRLLADEKRARAEAEEAVRLRDEFLSVASHELRTPLTSLQLAIQGLEQRLLQGMDVERAHWVVALAGRQIKRLANLLGLLLEVSRIQHGRLGLNRTEVDLSSVVNEVTTQLADELARSGCALVVNAAPVVMGLWDSQRLEQVVTNLLTNAMKFGKGQPIEIAVTTDGQTARLTVTDHGIGIPRDTQSSIFERFQRGVSSKHYGGLGLGLYITRTIVQAHGGAIGVTSEVGQGSTFTVELPLLLDCPPESKVHG